MNEWRLSVDGHHARHGGSVETNRQRCRLRHVDSHFVDDDYKAHAEAAWKRPDGTDEEALEIYRQLNQDLLDNAFLLEIATITPQVATTAGVSGYTWSKRNELQLDDVTLGG